MSKTIITKTSVAEGTDLYYVEDSKYKTNYFNIYFSMPLTKENATSASLLAKVLKRGSKSYPTMAQLNSALTMNYSTGLVFSSFKQGEKTVFMLSLSTMKNKYAPNGEDVFGKAVEIAFDSILEPLVENDSFVEEYFESEKRNLADSIASQINNKRAYSRTRFIKAMHENEAYSVNGEGDIEALEGLTGKQLYSFLKNMLKTAVCDIYFIGSESQKRVEELMKNCFSSLDRSPAARCKTPTTLDVTPREVSESLDITQAHLWIGYRTPVTYSSPDYLKFVLFNMVLGGDVTSKMFLNIREKLSLCYSCYSVLDGLKGTLSAYVGIAPENRDKTLAAFYEELENIRSGKVTQKELDDAKKAYVNRIREICDNPSLIPSWYYARLESDVACDPMSDAEELSRLTLDDVVWAAKQIKPDTVYFLTGNEK